MGRCGRHVWRHGLQTEANFDFTVSRSSFSPLSLLPLFLFLVSFQSITPCITITILLTFSFFVYLLNLFFSLFCFFYFPFFSFLLSHPSSFFPSIFLFSFFSPSLSVLFFIFFPSSLLIIHLGKEYLV